MSKLITMSLASSSPPLISSATDHNLSHITHSYIWAQIQQLCATDDKIEHTFQDLSQLYSKNLIDIYDLISMRHAESVKLQASQISASLISSFYTDIRCETGLTVLTCIRKLLKKANAVRTTVAVQIIDELERMIKLTVHRITSAAEDNSAFSEI